MDFLIYCQCTRTKCVRGKIGWASFCSRKRLLKRSVGGVVTRMYIVTKRSFSYIFKRFNLLIA